MNLLPLLAMLLAGAFGAAALSFAPGASAWAGALLLVTGLLIGAAGWLAKGRGLLLGAAGVLLFVIACAAGLAGAWLRDMRRLAVADIGPKLTEGAYQEFAEDSALLLRIDESRYREFMVKRNYTQAARPEDVTEEELQRFWTGTVPTLLEMQQDHPTYETWRERQLEVVTEANKLRTPLPDYVLERLSGLSMVYALLGLGVAALPALRRRESLLAASPQAEPPRSESEP